MARRDGVWVLRAHRLERWYAQPMSSPVLLDQAALSGEARDLMVGGGIGLLATDAGLQSVTATEAGLKLSAPIVACGRPLRIADLGSGRFAVSTTLGIAVVEASEEGVSLKSMTGLVPGADDGEELAMGTDAATIAACRAADAFLPGWFADSIAEYSPITAIGRDRVLAGRMGLLFDFDLHDIELELRGTKAAPFLVALRGDEGSQRGYTITRAGGKERTPIFDGRGNGAVKRRGEHDIAGWVTRSRGRQCTGAGGGAIRGAHVGAAMSGAKRVVAPAAIVAVAAHRLDLHDLQRQGAIADSD